MVTSPALLPMTSAVAPSAFTVAIDVLLEVQLWFLPPLVPVSLATSLTLTTPPDATCGAIPDSSRDCSSSKESWFKEKAALVKELPSRSLPFVSFEGAGPSTATLFASSLLFSASVTSPTGSSDSDCSCSGAPSPSSASSSDSSAAGSTASRLWFSSTATSGAVSSVALA